MEKNSVDKMLDEMWEVLKNENCAHPPNRRSCVNVDTTSFQEIYEAVC